MRHLLDRVNYSRLTPSRRRKTSRILLGLTPDDFTRLKASSRLETVKDFIVNFTYPRCQSTSARKPVNAEETYDFRQKLN